MTRYGGLVWSLARRFCYTSAEAEDAVQEIFVALWQNADRFDETRGAEATFVATIARRRLIDRRRKYERQERVVSSNKSIGDPAEPESGTWADTVDEAQRAAEALLQLKPQQQRVLRMAIFHGMTHEQIAENTDMPLGTVKTNVRRGLIRVREILAARTGGRS